MRAATARLRWPPRWERVKRYALYRYCLCTMFLLLLLFNFFLLVVIFSFGGGKPFGRRPPNGRPTTGDYCTTVYINLFEDNLLLLLRDLDKFSAKFYRFDKKISQSNQKIMKTFLKMHWITFSFKSFHFLGTANARKRKYTFIKEGQIIPSTLDREGVDGFR